jgi:16S rRNA (adenine1518-N6/adenine1519-N6)-dimethyltransferase
VNYDAPSEIKKILADHGIALKKRFGQNFLINRCAREKIIELLEAGQNSLVWEIGPGLGAMTKQLLAVSGRLFVFEIDRGLIRILNGLYGKEEKLLIIEGDAVANIASAAARYGMPDRVLGNLPYSSASQIIAAFIEAGMRPEKMVMMVQKELALRMTASPGTKSYSSFSLLCQSAFEMKLESELKGGNFYPPPEVVSAIVSFVPGKDSLDGEERKVFSKLIRVLFGSRRKTIRNNLQQADQFSDEQKELIVGLLQDTEFTPQARAEELPLSVYISISISLAKDVNRDPGTAI